MARVSIFLIIVTLISGIIGCAPPPLVQYNLAISSTEGGLVTSPGEGSFIYDEGKVVNLAATPATDHRFVRWTGDVDTIADLEDATTTITMNSNYTISADFEMIPPAQYGLTISSTSGGSVTSPGSGTFAYDAGTVVNLVAAAEEGYHFANWVGDVSTVANISAATTIITMNDSYSITANFEEIPPGQFDLTTSSTAGGYVTVPGERTFRYDTGTVVSLVANPYGGYYFVNWTGDVSTVANVNAASTTITMTNNCSITANFGVIPVTYYTLAMTVNGSGSTSPAVGQHTYSAGAVVSLAATPASGYRFVNWTGNVGTVANVNAATTTITMNEDYSITANFETAWIKNPTNGHYYALTLHLTWMQAEAWAQEQGGHLVTLRNWEEELWIRDTFGRNEYFWIGCNDIEAEGNWVWSSGEPVMYTNWAEYEPNNCGAPNCCPEDAAVINWALSGFGDYWNDLDSDTQCRGVAEIAAIDG